MERKFAKQAKKNPKQFYGYLKSKLSNRVTVGPLKDGEELVSEEEKMTTILNTYFSSVFTREDLTNIPSANQSYKGDQPLHTLKIDKSDVKKKLDALKPNSTPGPEKVWARTLHQLSDALAPALAIVFTRLLEEGAVPDIWKCANVSAVYKKGSKSDPGNYRPISLTCIICKVMEGIIRDRIVEHLLTNDIICSAQHGFLPGKSISTNLIEYLEVLTKLVDEGHSVTIHLSISVHLFISIHLSISFPHVLNYFTH